MPQQPVNPPSPPLTPYECVEHVFGDIAKLMACEACALRMACHDHGLSYSRVLVLWLDHER